MDRLSLSVSAAGLVLALGVALHPGVASAAPASPSAGPSAPAVNPAKPYTLYLGANFTIDWEGKLRPVQGVDGSSFVVDVDGRRVAVPTNHGPIRIRMDDSLKVTPSGVTVTAFKPERVYTLANDPNRRLSEAAQLAMGAAAMADLAVMNLNAMQSRQGRATQGVSSGRTPADLEQAAAAVESSAFAQSSPLNSLADAGARAGIELAQERYDAFKLTFEISAPTALKKPYAVIVTRLREDPEDAGTTRLWIYAEALPAVGPTPTRVSILRGGFTPGYALEEVQLHLYDGGTEVATNIARKRMEISADDALQFAVVDYVQQHRGATLDPVRLATTTDSPLPARLSSAQRNETYYVKVGKDGRPTAAFSDPNCTDRVADHDLETALISLRFNPALKEGKPIEAVTPVRL